MFITEPSQALQWQTSKLRFKQNISIVSLDLIAFNFKTMFKNNL